MKHLVDELLFFYKSEYEEQNQNNDGNYNEDADTDASLKNAFNYFTTGECQAQYCQCHYRNRLIFHDDLFCLLIYLTVFLVVEVPGFFLVIAPDFLAVVLVPDFLAAVPDWVVVVL